MFVPIGLEQARLSRVPWASIVLVVATAASFAAIVLTHPAGPVEERSRAVVEYWRDHPYLVVPADLADRLGLAAEPPGAGTESAPAAGPSLPAARLGTERLQARLDALCAELREAEAQLPEQRWALVPARGPAQLGWLTHPFVHRGVAHLLLDLLLLALVVGPFLEDAWGPALFLGLYLGGAGVAGGARLLLPGDAAPILGSSGAIAACLGAFAVRFAGRRVRLIHPRLPLLRGPSHLPAWAYALLALAVDVLGLRLDGPGSAAASAAHLGAFVFGLAVAAAVRAQGFEARLAPGKATRWGRTLAAADAPGAAPVARAREQLERAVARDPRNEAAMLALARHHARSYDRTLATPLIDRLVTAALARGDEEGARALLVELDAGIEPELVRPSTAYRAAALVADPELADRLDAVAARGGGALGAKALLRRAQRARDSDPARARSLALAARDAAAAPPDLRARAEAFAAAAGAEPASPDAPGARTPAPAPAPPDRPSAPRARARAPLAPRAPTPPPVAPRVAPPAPEPDPSIRIALELAPRPVQVLEPHDPVRLVHCRLLATSEVGLALATEEGKRALLPPDRVAAVAGAVIADLYVAGRAIKNAVLLDLLLHPRPGDRHRTVLRLRGHEMALAAIHPGVPAQEAYARVVERLLRESGAPAAPSPRAAAGRPFTRFGDTTAFEAASWGRPLVA